ncbi:MAG: HPr family phosphocarrier protein [bacterium]|nr:HPr family phosphocarrier protein [bacterium]
MLKKTVTIKSPNGLHLRVAAEIARIFRGNQIEAVFYKDGKTANAQSILELLILEAVQHSEVTVIAEGKDAQTALDDIALILMDGAGI